MEKTIIATHTKVTVSTLPNCDFPHGVIHGSVPAKYDCRIPGLSNAWANVCQHHFEFWGCELGLGKGQELIKKEQQ